MRVKVGNVWYDGRSTPICLEISSKDKKNIAAMPSETTKYAIIADGTITSNQIYDWMDDKIEL